MKKIVFSHNVPYHKLQKKLVNCEIIAPKEEFAAFSRAEIEKHILDADVLITIMEYKCDKSLIELGKNLQAIGNLGAGYNNIDVVAATEKKILVLNTPHSVTEPTAEMTVALILAISRSVVLYDRDLRRERTIKPSLFFERDLMVYGKTLGVLGFGRIGKSVAKKAKGLGMKIIYFDLFRQSPEIEAEFDAVYMPAEEILASADVVTLHMPYTPEYHHYMNAERLSFLKKTAYLINASRGQIVDEKALIEVLKNKSIRGAALDVHEFEPNISADIAALDNIVITPHCCTNIYEVRMNMLAELISGIGELLEGGKPLNVVNKV